MALFKILRGPSSGLAQMPLKDGYCYFTPDTGLFHVDYEVAPGDVRRIPISASTLNGAVVAQTLRDEELEIPSSALLYALNESISGHISAAQSKANEAYELAEGKADKVHTHAMEDVIKNEVITWDGVFADENLTYNVYGDMLYKVSDKDIDISELIGRNVTACIGYESGGEYITEYGDNSISEDLIEEISEGAYFINQIFIYLITIDNFDILGDGSVLLPKGLYFMKGQMHGGADIYASALYLNDIVPIINGGTGASTVEQARINLGIGNILDGWQDGSLRTTGASPDDDEYTLGMNAFAQGYNTKASGEYAFASGWDTEAIGDSSHAEGHDTRAIGSCSHAEGYWSTASGYCAHSEGDHTKASGSYSHAEGETSEATGRRSHAEGYWSIASGEGAHSEGYRTQAAGDYSHTEGYMSKSTATGKYAHVEGYYSEAAGENQHV